SRMASPSAAHAAVALRRAVQQRDAIFCEGKSTVVGMAPALRFELFEHPQPDLDGRYKLISIEHHFGPSLRGEHGAYTNDFQCIPHSFEWRPARRRSRPRIYGIQTATVVAPPGEEIHTDEHGRIKVQFHWDRRGKYDQNSS